VKRRAVVGALAALPFVLPTRAMRRTTVLKANDFGVKGDGATLNTGAIQATIDRAAQTGATVRFARGVYLTGSLFLKSGVTLMLEEGVRLLGSQSLDDYALIQTRVAGIEMVWPAALLNIYKQSGVRIEGNGVIDGDGKVFWDSYWKLRQQYDPRGLRWAADYDCRRPRLVHIYDSSDVKVRGLHLRRSGFWTVHVCYSQDVLISEVTIRNNEGGRGPSTDGIDVDSSRGVVVEKADIECNDDALCMKAGRDSDGLRVARPTQDVTIRDCVIRDAAAGVTFGSETSGGFHRIDVSGLRVLGPTPIGILFKSALTRGGRLSDIQLRHIQMQNVPTIFRVNLNWNPQYSYATIPAGSSGDSGRVPSYWHVLAAPVSRAEGVPRLSDVRVSDVVARGAGLAFDVAAYPEEPLRHFRFDRLDWESRSGGHIENAVDWVFRRSRLRTTDGSHPIVRESTDVTGLS
jgi:polygalacturonase